MHLLMLEQALRLEIYDPSFGRPESWEAHRGDEDVEDHKKSEVAGENGETSEAAHGHAPFAPTPSRNIPNPQPLPSSPRAGTKSREGNRRRNTEASAGGDSGRTPKLEKQHIELLKGEHYASHCQMCLCERSPSELAPRGSYVEWEELRRLVLEAHHVDPKAGGGARHAGNLMVLCTLHHNNYGGRLTRQTVTEAMRKTRHEKTVRFGDTDGHDSEVTGRVICVVIPDNDDAVSIFFTEEHVGYWLEAAQPRAA
jgi:hypothetical protein